MWPFDQCGIDSVAAFLHGPAEIRSLGLIDLARAVYTRQGFVGKFSSVKIWTSRFPDGERMIGGATVQFL
jgi:hypothetical protein